MSQSEDLQFRFLFNRPGATLSPRLDWLVTASLAQIDRQGRVRGVLHTAARHVARLASHGEAVFHLPFNFKPGLYRLEIVFQNKGGKRLGRFGDYFRALQRNPDSRLTLNGSSFGAGETVSAQAGEYGFGWMTLDDVYSIESYDGSTWSKAPISPTQISLLIGPLLGPGDATTCWDFPIPVDAPPGLYRFVLGGMTLGQQGKNKLGWRSPLVLTSEFNILPSQG